jgi:ABC-type glutathione transport system ATPase component
MSTSAGPPSASVKSPAQLRRLFTYLSAYKEQDEGELRGIRRQLEHIRTYLSLSDKVTVALEQLNEQLFSEVLDTIKEKLTIALQEVLEQPIVLQARPEWKRNAASVEFWIERDGHKEDILKGQGGSVANILSVGLRMFALTTLEEKTHRRFLVLDEQDCWLHPALVPKLVKIVHEAGDALGFQVLMISHHHAGAFAQYADRIYRLVPAGDKGVHARLCDYNAT